MDGVVSLVPLPLLSLTHFLMLTMNFVTPMISDKTLPMVRSTNYDSFIGRQTTTIERYLIIIIDCINSNILRRQKFRGLFRGPLVVQVFAAHFNVISGSKWINGLYEGSSPPKPRAPLALAAAAVSPNLVTGSNLQVPTNICITTKVERVLTLWATGTITIAMVREAKATKKAIKLPAMINPETGKQSARHTAFSELSWGKPTRSYLESIEKNVDDVAMEKIMDEAKEFSKASHGANDESAAGSFDPDDDRANLQDGSGSSSESGDDAPSQSD